MITTTYPTGGGTETRTYDSAGNLATFKNRIGNTQTFIYDTRNRETYFSWDDGITSPRWLYYDDASRITACDDWNANITFTYYFDNLLKTETESINNYGDQVPRTVTYTYDADGERATLQYPSGEKFKYDYTARGQLLDIYDQTLVGSPYQVKYTYDDVGNPTARNLNGKTTFTDPNFTSSAYDGVNRLTFTHHYMNTANITWSHLFQYGYDKVGNRTYEMRDWQMKGDGFQYDLANQITGYEREGTVDTSTGAVSGAANNDTLTFDASGNRASLVDNGTTTSYTRNSLNQYSAVTGLSNPTYDGNGNLKTYKDWTFGYNAMNQLISVTKGTNTGYFWYDGLGRICTRQINGGDGVRYQVWAGWDLVEDYKMVDDTLDTRYLQGEGTDEMVSITTGGQKILSLPGWAGGRIAGDRFQRDGDRDLQV